MSNNQSNHNEIEYPISLDEDIKGNAIVNICEGIFKLSINLITINRGNFQIDTKLIYNNQMDWNSIFNRQIGFCNWKLNIEQHLFLYNSAMNLDGYQIGDYVYIDGNWQIHRLVKYKTNQIESIDYYYCTDVTGIVLKKTSQNGIIEDDQTQLVFNNNGLLTDIYSKINNNIHKVITYNNNRIDSIYDNRLASSAIIFSYDNGLLIEAGTTNSNDSYLFTYNNNLLTKIYHNYPIIDKDYLWIEYSGQRMSLIADCEKMIGISLSYYYDKLASLFTGAVIKQYDRVARCNLYPTANQYVNSGTYIKNTDVSINSYRYILSPSNTKYKKYFTYEDNYTIIRNEKGVQYVYYFDNDHNLLSVLEKTGNVYYAKTNNLAFELTNEDGTNSLKINGRKSFEVSAHTSYSVTQTMVSAFLSHIVMNNDQFEYHNYTLSFWMMPLNDVLESSHIIVTVQKLDTDITNFSNIITPMKSGTIVKVEVPLYLDNNDSSEITSISIRLNKNYIGWLFNDLKVTDRYASEILIDNQKFSNDKIVISELNNIPNTHFLSSSFYLTLYDILATYKNMYVAKMNNQTSFDLIACNGTYREETESVKVGENANNCHNLVLDSTNNPNISLKVIDTKRYGDLLETSITYQFLNYLNDSYDIRCSNSTQHNNTYTFTTSSIVNNLGLNKSQIDQYGVKTEYSYDTYGNVEQITTSNINSNNSLSISEIYGYGNILPINRMTPLSLTKNGVTTNISYSSNYKYINAISRGNLEKRFSYDYLDRVTNIQFVDKSTNQSIKEHTIYYNESGQISLINDGYVSFNYQYDSLGNVKSISCGNRLIESFSRRVNGDLADLIYNTKHLGNCLINSTLYTNKYGYLLSSQVDDDITTFSYEHENDTIRQSRVKRINDPYNGHHYNLAYFDEYLGNLSYNSISEYENNTLVYSKTQYNNQNIVYQGIDNNLYAKIYTFDKELGLYEEYNSRLLGEKYKKDTYFYVDDIYNNTTTHDEPGTINLYAYDELGRVTSIESDVTANNNIAVQFNETIEYNDNNSLPSELCFQIYRHINITTRTDIDYSIGYDSLNRYSSIDKQSNDNNIASESSSYSYDVLGRLISECINNNQYDYLYDVNHLTSIKYNNNTIKTFTYVDQFLTSIIHNNQTININYDNYGNMISIGSAIISYNSQNKMSMYRVGTDAYRYYYNHQGCRYKKEIVHNIDTNNEEIEIINYILDNDRVLSETRIYQNVAKKMVFYYNINGMDLIEYNNKKYKLLKDPLGNITEIVYLGKIIGQYHYDAYGNHTISIITANIDNNELEDATYVINNNPFRYKSYYYDIETNLFLVSSRYYSPELCRWISPDDIEYLDPESVNGLNLYCYCLNNPIMYVDPSGHIAISTLILCGLALVGMGLTIGGVVSDNNTMTAIGLTMVSIPAMISGVGALFSGATYLSIIGGVTAGAGLFTGAFATAEYQEAFTGNNWIIDTTGMSEELYNGLMLTTAAIATAGTIATGVLTSVGNAATPNQMMNSLQSHPNRWKTVKELVEPARGGYRGGTSTYTNYINKWTGSKLGTHKIIRAGRFIHGPHFHPWI